MIKKLKPLTLKVFIRTLRRAVLPSAFIWLASCVPSDLPSEIAPVSNFNAEQYLGTWYEIARFDNRFEKGLTHVTANYTRNDDGSIRVTNRGWNAETSEWSESVGKAKFVKSEDVGYLKVSFFGPFYAPYVIMNLDANYENAYVTNADKTYLWWLSRDPSFTDEDKSDFLQDIQARGYDASSLLWVEQDPTKQ